MLSYHDVGTPYALGTIDLAKKTRTASDSIIITSGRSEYIVLDERNAKSKEVGKRRNGKPKLKTVQAIEPLEINPEHVSLTG